MVYLGLPIKNGDFLSMAMLNNQRVYIYIHIPSFIGLGSPIRSQHSMLKHPGTLSILAAQAHIYDLNHLNSHSSLVKNHVFLLATFLLKSSVCSVNKKNSSSGFEPFSWVKSC